MTMNHARAQLWGGVLDGLRARVEVGRLSGPPDFVDVPRNPATMPIMLRPYAEHGQDMEGVETVRYRLDLDHMGEELLYRIERVRT